MKIFFRLLLPALFLGGCASTGQPPPALAATAPLSTARASLPAAPLLPADPLPGPEARAEQPLAEQPAPDAVIEIEPGSAALAPEMRARLAEIVRLLKEDERSQLRLEGYVPDGGSPAWNLGVAEKSLRLVREYLESLRVPAYRMQLAAFGGEHAQRRDDRRHWVEVYLLRGRR